MSSTCNYCNLTNEDHNLCQENACNAEFKQYLSSDKRSHDVNEAIHHRWTYSR